MDTSIAKARDAATTPLTRAVLSYSCIFKDLMDKAKKTKLTPADWAPLADLVAVDEFKRVGVYKEVMDWKTYAGFLSDFANGAEWEGTFKRITEVPNLVFLELEERTKMPGFSSVANTLTVYGFNKAGKLSRLDVYYQHDQPT